MTYVDVSTIQLTVIVSRVSDLVIGAVVVAGCVVRAVVVARGVVIASFVVAAGLESMSVRCSLRNMLGPLYVRPRATDLVVAAIVTVVVTIVVSSFVAFLVIACGWSVCSIS